MDLTPHRVKILKLVSEGLTNKEIAQELHMSLTTVKRHIQRIKETLEAKNRPHTVYIGIRQGIV